MSAFDSRPRSRRETPPTPEPPAVPPRPERPTALGLDMATTILRRGLDAPIPVPGRFLIGVNPDALRIVLDALDGPVPDPGQTREPDDATIARAFPAGEALAEAWWAPRHPGVGWADLPATVRDDYVQTAREWINAAQAVAGPSGDTVQAPTAEIAGWDGAA